jgi:hypothetical protein
MVEVPPAMIATWVGCLMTRLLVAVGLLAAVACARAPSPLLVPPLDIRGDSLAEARWIARAAQECPGQIKVLFDEGANDLVRDSLARPVFRARRHLIGVQCGPR